MSLSANEYGTGEYGIAEYYHVEPTSSGEYNIGEYGLCEYNSVISSLVTSQSQGTTGAIQVEGTHSSAQAQGSLLSAEILAFDEFLESGQGQTAELVGLIEGSLSTSVSQEADLEGFIPGRGLGMWDGSQWIIPSLYRWNGSSWVPCILKIWTGATWAS